LRNAQIVWQEKHHASDYIDRHTRRRRIDPLVDQQLPANGPQNQEDLECGRRDHRDPLAVVGLWTLGAAVVDADRLVDRQKEKK
jgi:hypothetical protein